MYNYFTKDCLSINLERDKDNNLHLYISSDYGNGRYHKQQLYACEKRLASALEDLWKSVKSKKLQSVHVGFGECDHYDNMTDMYDTPTAYMRRGKRRAEIGSREHDSIPKDWEVHLTARILNTTTISPILEVIKNAIGFNLYKPMEKLIIKNLRPVLQKKKNYIHFGLYED
jgi:hypothetical protein